MSLRILPAGTIPARVHHTFTDETLADLVATMGDTDEAGIASFEFALRFDHANNRLTRVDLTMRLALGMPVWENADTRPEPEQEEWSRFLRALRVHEDGHIAIFRREAPTTYRRLVRSTPKRINDVLAEEEGRIQALSDAHDHRTDHGRTQPTPHGTTVVQLP